MIEDEANPIKMQETLDAEKPLVMSKKKSVKKNITKADKFIVNRAFKSKMKRIQVNSLQKKETRADSDAVHDKVLQDRKLYVDAAIVKTMKARKKMKQNELIAEVIRMTRFPCEVETILQRIKALIETEYMEPDKSDEKVYHYLA